MLGRHKHDHKFYADAPCLFARKFTMAPASRSGLLAVHCLHIHLLLKTFPLKGFMLSSDRPHVSLPEEPFARE